MTHVVPRYTGQNLALDPLGQQPGWEATPTTQKIFLVNVISVSLIRGANGNEVQRKANVGMEFVFMEVN